MTTIIEEAAGLEAFIEQAGEEFAVRLAPRLTAALAAAGVASPAMLPPALRAALFKQAVIETAVAHFPETDFGDLRRTLDVFQHPAFGPALREVVRDLGRKTDAFEMATGYSAGVFLAGAGLAVGPQDKKSLRMMGPLVDTMDQAVAAFSQAKTAFVGYSPCTAPFYLLVTDCLRSVHHYVANDERLGAILSLLGRYDVTLPSPPVAFRHGLILLPREPGDRFESFGLNSDAADQGSVMFYAGWVDSDGELQGVSNGGYMPVPHQLLRSVATQPSARGWLTRPVGAHVAIH